MVRVVIALAAVLLVAGVASGETLTLKECLTRAELSNKGLKADRYSIGIAQEQEKIAGSTLRPRIDVQGSYTAQQEAQAVRLNNVTAATQDADYGAFSLSIYDTLYDFGKTRAREGAAAKQKDAATHSLAADRQDLFLQVVRAYYGILEAGKLVTAANDEVASMSSHQQTAKALYDEGVVTRNDLLQAEVRVASAKQKLFRAQNAVENGWLVLNYLIGSPADARLPLREEPLEPVPPSPATPDLSRRGELLALKDTVAAQEFLVKEAKTNYYPELFARLGFDYQQNSKVTEQAIMSATVGLKVNLYDGGAKTAQLRQAVQARSRAEERLQDLEERVRLELARAQNDLQVAAARIKVAEKAIAQGVENLRITNDRYQEKVGTATEVVDAQTLLTETRTDYYQSVFDYQVAAARVKRATGDL
ncbi:TolC family protein [Geomonas sp.]|uniref:TolC family protein n=1 Tax=Geomonas sp. TaxID=2651584 RepID=UPI002B4A3C15|nr:TolC family protein [Geomonas sp.]HJV35379.1 TolC family protein [Geomonas sp.]